MSWIQSIFKSRDKPQDRTISTYPFFMGKSTSGKMVNQKTAMQVSAVYACVRVLAEAVAQLPLHVYEITDDGLVKATDHPLYFLLHNEPNPEQTSFVYRETVLTHLLLWGNSYSQIIRNGKNEVIALYPLMPDRMTVNRDENGQIYYEYLTYGDDLQNSKQGVIRLSASDVLHIPALGFDGLVGYSPIAMARNSIGMAISTEEYGSKFYENGAAPSGILQHPGTLKDPQKVRESWEAAFGGSANSHRTAVLEEGMTYQPISIAPADSQFIESRKFSIEEIARIFRVPPSFIGDLDHTNFSSVEQMSLDFSIYTLTPWLVRLEQGMEKSLLNRNEKTKYCIKFNMDGLLRAQYQSRMAGYATGIQNGILTPNDCRAKEGLDLFPDETGANRLYVNGNMLPLELAGAAYIPKENVEVKNNGQEDS